MCGWVVYIDMYIDMCTQRMRHDICHMYAWCMLHDMGESYMWTSRSTRVDESRHAYQDTCCTIWMSDHIWMNHSTHMNEAQHAYEWVASHVPKHKKCVARYGWVMNVNESQHAYKLATECVWMSHGTRMNESRHTYQDICCTIWMSHMYDCVMTCVWMSHTCEWVTSRVRMGRVTFIKIYVARYGLVICMNELQHAYTCVTACVWTSCGMRMNCTRMIASRHAYEWVVLRVSRPMLHVMYES